MSFSDRRHFLIAGASALLLAGCFRPMLAKDESARKLRSLIALPTFDDRFGYFLNDSLVDRLGEPASPAYRLEVSTNVTERGLAVAQDNSVTRVTLLAQASWSLWRIGASEAQFSDTVTAQSGYSATTSLFATRQSRLDIERRLARDIGERIARIILARADELGS